MANPIPLQPRPTPVGAAPEEPVAAPAWTATAAATAGPLPRHEAPPPAPRARTAEHEGGSTEPAQRAAEAMRILRERRLHDARARSMPSEPQRAATLATKSDAAERPRGVTPLPRGVGRQANDAPKAATRAVQNAVRPSAVPTPKRQAEPTQAKGDSLAVEPTAVTVHPGDAVRLDLLKRTGCALRGPVAFWPNTLPAWLELNRANGILTGTVPLNADAVVPLGIVAANGSGATALLSLTLSVRAADGETENVAEVVGAIEDAMRSTLDALPRLRALVEEGRGSGRIRLRA